MNTPFLLSNSFPLSLVRRRVVIEPQTVETLMTEMALRPWVSTWGHPNTVEVASTILCADVRPATARPVLTLSEALLPRLDGQEFTECWLFTPDYVPGFRPAVGEEVGHDQIRDWQAVRLVWANLGN